MIQIECAIFEMNIMDHQKRQEHDGNIDKSMTTTNTTVLRCALNYFQLIHIVPSTIDRVGISISWM